MKQLFLKALLLVMLITHYSCIKDVNLNQINELELTPVFPVAIAKLTIPQTLLVNPSTGSELPTPITDRISFSALENVENKEYLEKIDTRIEISNGFNRGFVLNFRLLDANGTETYMLPAINVEPNNLDFTYDTEIEIASNPNFLNSTQVEVTIELLPSGDGSTINPNIAKEFVFKSAGIFYFRI